MKMLFFSGFQPGGEVLSTTGKARACSQPVEQDCRNASHQHRQQQLGRFLTHFIIKPADSWN